MPSPSESWEKDVIDQVFRLTNIFLQKGYNFCVGKGFEMESKICAMCGYAKECQTVMKMIERSELR